MYSSPHALDEITNKVFNEVLIGKSVSTVPRLDVDSAKSDDFYSEVSSTSKNVHQRTPFQPQGLAVNKTLQQSKNLPGRVEDINIEMKKPLITKLIQGVNVQTSSKTQGEGT